MDNYKFLSFLIKKYESVLKYHNVLLDEISSIINDFENNKADYNSNFKKLFGNVLSNSESRIEKIFSSDIINHYDEQDLASLFVNKRKDIDQIIIDINNSIKTTYNLSVLKRKSENVIIIGGNGSGKTTFLNDLMKKIDAKESIRFFPAERLYVKSDNFQKSYKYSAFLKELEQNEQNAFNEDSNIRGRHISDVFNFNCRLLGIHFSMELQNGIQRENTKANKVLKYWNTLIKTRRLNFSDNDLVAKYKSIDYPVKHLSSGEKALLNFLVAALIRDPAQYYFVDEPENNLNPDLVNKLFDILESEFPDSIFVYLTHDSNFVSSRINAKKYWMKEYDGSNWLFEEFQSKEDLPEELLIRLLGNKRPIIFCESKDEDKLDYKVYSMMFPEFRIIASNGCDSVIKKTKAYNDLKLEKSFGIIDRDYKSDEYIDGQIKNNVYCLPFFEIENFLVSREILYFVLSEIGFAGNKNQKLDDIKQKLNHSFESIKHEIASRHLSHVIKSAFVSMGISENPDKEVLKSAFYDKIQSFNFEGEYIKLITLYDSIITKNELNEMLRYYDRKNLILREIGNESLENQHYDEIILPMLKRNGLDLLSDLRKKYFPDIKL